MFTNVTVITAVNAINAQLYIIHTYIVAIAAVCIIIAAILVCLLGLVGLYKAMADNVRSLWQITPRRMAEIMYNNVKFWAKVLFACYVFCVFGQAIATFMDGK